MHPLHQGRAVLLARSRIRHSYLGKFPFKIDAPHASVNTCGELIGRYVRPRGIPVTSRDKRIKLSKNKIAKQTKRIRQIEALISELKRTAATLNYDLRIEEQRSQYRDPTHFAYPTFAVLARTRRVNIVHSMQALERQLSALLQSLNESKSELSALERLEGPPLSPEEG